MIKSFSHAVTVTIRHSAARGKIKTPKSVDRWLRRQTGRPNRPSAAIWPQYDSLKLDMHRAVYLRLERST
jgi:hypothetical protein